MTGGEIFIRSSGVGYISDKTARDVSRPGGMIVLAMSASTD